MKNEKMTNVFEAIKEIVNALSSSNEEDIPIFSNEKTKVSYIPEKYQKDFFKELLSSRGPEGYLNIVLKNKQLSEAFVWDKSYKGHKFWSKVEKETVENYDKIHGLNNEKQTPLQAMIEEAESRGFGEGVSTIHGVIKSKRTEDSEFLEHELTDDGDFFYHNIRVFKNGRWIDANVPEEENSHEVFSEALKSSMEKFFESLKVR